jgi:hypothetical protein
MSATIETPAEYAYETPHLKESEVADRYTREKSRYPDAIVTIDNLDCGHFNVEVYRTENEKQAFYNRHVNRLLKRLWASLSTG